MAATPPWDGRAAALPVLSPAQRAIAAQKLRDRAEALEDVAPAMP
jgi:hypothetical protein